MNVELLFKYGANIFWFENTLEGQMIFLIKALKKSKIYHIIIILFPEFGSKNESLMENLPKGIQNIKNKLIDDS